MSKKKKGDSHLSLLHKRLKKAMTKDKKRKLIERAVRAGKIDNTLAQELVEWYVSDNPTAMSDTKFLLVSGHGGTLPKLRNNNPVMHYVLVGKGEAPLSSILSRLEQTYVWGVCLMYYHRSFKEKAEYYAQEIEAVYPDVPVMIEKVGRFNE